MQTGKAQFPRGSVVSASSSSMACSLFQITQLFQLQGLQFLSLHNEREALRIQITP